MSNSFNFEEIPNFKEIIENGGFVIPIEVIKNNQLKVNEKIYLSIYLNNNKNIEITDNRFLKMFNKYKLKKAKNNLLKLKIIEKKKTLNIEELKLKAIELSQKGEKCEWCKKSCYILHKHHFPLSQKEGGKDIVNICPNCHYTFHKLEQDNIRGV